MNERLVEWTLLRERNYLQECIDLPLESKVCQQYTTKYGRIDFAHKIKNGGYLITELETVLDAKPKLSYCFGQCLEYKNIVLANNYPHKVAILYAVQTPENYCRDIAEFCQANNMLLYTYDLEKIKNLYNDEMQKSLMNNGALFSNPVSMNFTHLAGLNRLFIPFFERQAEELNKNDLKQSFNVIGTGRTETIFNVHCSAARFFDLIIKENGLYKLTDYGIRFRDNINSIEIVDDVKRIELSVEQKRILIESLLNGNFHEKKSKINIYYFLKFIALTEGEWIPRGRIFNKRSEFEFVNSFFRMDYSEGSVADLLRFTCNHCIELELIEKIKTTSFYDRVVFTSLGARVLAYMEQDIQAKREKIQIPLQI